MSEVDKAVVMEWAKLNYPNVTGNYVLCELLYLKAMNKNPVVRAMNSPFEVKIKEIRGLIAKTKVAFKGLVAESQIETYDGCPECKRKNCSHGKEAVVLSITKMLIGDDSDMIWVSFFEMKNVIKDGTEVEVIGVVKDWNSEKSVSGFELKVAEKKAVPVVEAKPVVSKGSKEDKINRIVQFVEGSRKVTLQMFKTMVQNEGLDFNEVAKLVVVDVPSNAVYPQMPDGAGNY
jgi:RecG-like helicase